MDQRNWEKSRDKVIVVHGLAASTWVTSLLASRLRNHGFNAINWGYPAVRGKIEQHARRLSTLLRDLERDSKTDAINLVAHSMGGIITRLALATNEFTKVRRIVMLGPPNAGSPVATKLSRYVGSICPALRQLSDDAESFVNMLPSLPHEVGIIAASRDRVVPIDNTQLKNQTDHVVVDSGHIGLLFRRPVFRQICGFLRNGQFLPRTLNVFSGTPGGEISAA